jgi:hypothetical protein
MSGCAIGPDGQLLDASQITFYNDVDDDVPISGPGSIVTPAVARPGSPTAKIAGSRRPHRVVRPSTKARDPNNTESSIKRKSDNEPTAPRVLRKRKTSHAKFRTIDNDDSNSDYDGDEYSPSVNPEVSADDNHYEDSNSGHAGDTDIENDDSESAYASTRAMGDADRAVS